MNRKAYTDKILVIGVDGLQPRLSKKVYRRRTDA